MTNELKPVRCGCGGKARTELSGEPFAPWIVKCPICGIRTELQDTEAEAVEAWNSAMSGNVQDCAKNARCSERTAKVRHLERRSETSMTWEGICTNCNAYTMLEMNYCFHCGARLEWG